MQSAPESIRQFLAQHRIAIAGLSRHGDSAANHIAPRLRARGYEIVGIHPHADDVAGVPCYRSVGDVPGVVDAVLISTHPDVSASVVDQAAASGVRRVWLHRSFGAGSVSPAAVEACARHGIDAIVGGCPLMYAAPVDIGHRCMRMVLSWTGGLPR